MFKIGFACVMLPFALAGIEPASAQHIRGRVLDLESREPVAAALVTLIAATGAPVAAVSTDESGHWQLAVTRPGIYRASARRVGYHPWSSGPLEVKQDDEVTLTFRLRRAAVTLDPVEVSAQAMRQYLDRAGFYERQRADFGHYITPEAIEKRRAARITDLLLSVPGVNLVRMATGSVGPLYVQLRGSNLSHGGVCRPRVFVDGVLFARGDSRPARPQGDAGVERRVAEQLRQLDQGLSLDDIGHPSTIAAIEVYRSATQVPVQFGGTSVGTLCGAIVIWTRTGTRRTSR